jgi:DNA-binding transcriptional ArsR family regulator
MTYHDIDRIVARHFNVTVCELRSKSLKERIVLARDASMLLCHEILKASSNRLCRWYDKRSHSTTLRALKVAGNMRDTDKLYRARIVAADQDCREFFTRWPDRKQRFNLHYRVRAKGMILNTKTKTVSITEDQARILEDGQLKKLLIKHNYAIQYSIL